MNERGATFLEFIVAIALGSVTLLAISSFYLVALRFTVQNDSQIVLQRQGALIIEEMARQIRPATALTVGECNADVYSLRAINALGSFCFYRSGNHLAEDRSSGGTANLLAGAPVALTVSDFASSLSGTTATITFQLRDNAQNSMTFTTTIARRN